MSNARWRPTVVVALVGVYIAFSIVTYSDYPNSNSHAPLNDLERQGLALWRRNNCQACHQIYGFGGFLGPDLTNRVDEDTLDEEFSGILLKGSGKMPAFKFSRSDQEAILAYLRAVNRTGQAQPDPLQARRKLRPDQSFSLLTDEWKKLKGEALPSVVARGEFVWHDNRCFACHAPLSEGRVRAPDLTGRALDWSPERISRILYEGSGRMPSFKVEQPQVAELCEYFKWLSVNRSELVKINRSITDLEEFSLGNVPWFEYR
jgi:nitric oxide reductase subunit C